MRNRWMVDGIEIDASGIKQKCAPYSADECDRLERAIERAERRSRQEIVYFADCNGRAKVVIEGGFAISMLQGLRKTYILDVSTPHLPEGFDGPEVLVSIDGGARGKSSFHVLTRSAPRAWHDGRIGLGGAIDFERLMLIGTTSTAEPIYAPSSGAGMFGTDDLDVMVRVVINPRGNFDVTRVELTRSKVALALAIAFIKQVVAAAHIAANNALETIGGSVVLTGKVEAGPGKTGTAEILRLLSANADRMVALGYGDDDGWYFITGVAAAAGAIDQVGDIDLGIAKALVAIDDGIVFAGGAATGSGKSDIVRLLVQHVVDGRDIGCRTFWHDVMIDIDGDNALDMSMAEITVIAAKDAVIDGTISAGAIETGKGTSGVGFACERVSLLSAAAAAAVTGVVVVLNNGDDMVRKVRGDASRHRGGKRRGNGEGRCRGDHDEELVSFNATKFTKADGYMAGVSNRGFMLNGVSTGRRPSAAYKNVRMEDELSH